jgi:hypothetical protein
MKRFNKLIESWPVPADEFISVIVTYRWCLRVLIGDTAAGRLRFIPFDSADAELLKV